MRTIEAGEIRALSQKLQQTTLEYERDALRAKLDRIADARKFDGFLVIGDDMVDSDEATALLNHHGRCTVADSFAMWHDMPRSPEPPRYKRGLGLFGLSDQNIERLAASFGKGEILAEVVDVVVSQWSLIKSLHPDKYPFEDWAYDVLSVGLSQAGFDTDKIWQGVETAFKERGRPDLTKWYGYDDSNGSLVGFLAHYALTKYDIRKLDRARREIYF